MPQFIASCAKGLEYLLKDELTALGAEDAKEGLSQVSFDADWAGVYTMLMWSRVASRIFYPIATFTAEDDDTLYQHASIIDWSQHLKSNASFLVKSQTYRSKLSHSQFISQRIKDAVVDYFKDAGENRPDVEFDQPDLVIHARLRHNKVTLSIDLAGAGMHHRGYREQGGGAPIKENLAASLLMRAGHNPSYPCVFDPMSGSGTFLIEAAMISCDIAPGLDRTYLGLFGWQQFNLTLWQSVVDDAIERKQTGIQNNNQLFIGSDINPKAVRNAQLNIANAELSDLIKVHIGGIDQIAQLDLPESGLLIVNPPYSERLGERDEVKRLYHDLGQVLKSQFTGWQASVLSPDKDFGHALGIRAKKIYKFNNGSLACELLNLSLSEESFIERRSDDQVDDNFKQKLSEQAMMLCNRIEKNKAKLKKFLQKESITCYRVYDADLPEYNAAIDVYDGRLHIQEYKAPKSIDDKTANRRIKEIERVAAGVFELPVNQVFTKQRRRQKGDWQYTSQNTATNPIEFKRQTEKNYFNVVEAGRKLRVNLIDYLDTGLFLDHRKTRQLIADKAKNKSILNLFCYTASVSLYAATAGAKSTCNVDMSRNYLEWAEKNFILNKVNLNNHQFIREDCLEWLKSAVEQQQTFDLIFLDPPTFSNSKKMEADFDVQTDHVWIIESCLKLLNKGGELIFSNNFQKFNMLVESSDQLLVKEITKQTASPDFSRNNLHRCWSIQLRD
jgi:23S rRNA (guanine2445-N2)-methyltransferase / 23S rRNA (guanine2069-N7)-methyltransferase